MSLAELIDAANKLREAAPGALQELTDGATKALGKAEMAPKFWIRLDAQNFPKSCTTEQLTEALGEGERDVLYRPV